MLTKIFLISFCILILFCTFHVDSYKCQKRNLAPSMDVESQFLQEICVIIIWETGPIIKDGKLEFRRPIQKGTG